MLNLKKEIFRFLYEEVLRKGRGRKTDIILYLYQAPSPKFLNHFRREVINDLGAQYAHHPFRCAHT